MQYNMLQQMIDLNKLAVDNSFKVMTAFQEQAEKMVLTYLEQSPGVPDAWKKAFKEWTDVYKKCCEDCRRSIDESFGKLEALYTSTK